MRRGFALSQRRPDVETIEGKLHFVDWGAAQLNQGRVPIDDVDWLSDLAARGDVPVPRGEGGDPHTALVERALACPELAVVGDNARARTAVVAAEDEQRVLPRAAFSTASTILPTASSIAVSIAAYWRRGRLRWAWRSRYFSEPGAAHGPR